MTELTTRRLRLRPLAPEDAPAMSALLDGDAEAIRMTERLPFPCTVEASRDWIALRTVPGETVFAIFGPDGTMIGAIGFMRAADTAGLGYWLGRRQWGRGYATEAVLAVLAHAASAEIHTVLADVFADNPASARVLEKCGFAEIGTVTKENVPTRDGPQTLRRFEARLSAT